MQQIANVTLTLAVSSLLCFLEGQAPGNVQPSVTIPTNAYAIARLS